MEKSLPEKLEKSVEIGTLCAFYGGLLTQRQQDALRLHYEEDLSLGEIAEMMEGSRQNVHELITRSVAKLRHYEQILGMVAKAGEAAELLHRADALLSGEPAGEDIAGARKLIRQVIRSQEGEENEHGI